MRGVSRNRQKIFVDDNDKDVDEDYDPDQDYVHDLTITIWTMILTTILTTCIKCPHNFIAGQLVKQMYSSHEHPWLYLERERCICVKLLLFKRSRA